MRDIRNTTGAGAAILVFALLLPAPAVSQQPEAPRALDSAAESTDSEVVIATARPRRTGSTSLSPCDPANVNVENSLKSTVFPYYLADCVSSYAPVDGDWGPDGPAPSSPASYLYPDTRFDRAAAEQQLAARRRARPASPPYTVRTTASYDVSIPQVREPLGEASSMGTVQLPVHTEPVVTRRIMEQRILQGKIQRGEIVIDRRSGYDPDRHDGSDPSRSAARRVRSQPAASRSAAPPRSSTSKSASSPSSSGQSQPKGRRGSRASSSPQS